MQAKKLDVEAVRWLAKDGMTDAEIGSWLGCSAKEVGIVRRRYGVKRRATMVGEQRRERNATHRRERAAAFGLPPDLTLRQVDILLVMLKAAPQPVTEEDIRTALDMPPAKRGKGTDPRITELAKRGLIVRTHRGGLRGGKRGAGNGTLNLWGLSITAIDMMANPRGRHEGEEENPDCEGEHPERDHHAGGGEVEGRPPPHRGA